MICITTELKLRGFRSDSEAGNSMWNMLEDHEKIFDWSYASYGNYFFHPMRISHLHYICIVHLIFEDEVQYEDVDALMGLLAHKYNFEWRLLPWCGKRYYELSVDDGDGSFVNLLPSLSSVYTDSHSQFIRNVYQ